MDIKKLSEIYGRDTVSSCIVAEICDEVLDRSGALLGKVRDEAKHTKSQRSNGVTMTCRYSGCYNRATFGYMCDMHQKEKAV